MKSGSPSSGVLTAVPSRAPEICEQVVWRLALLGKRQTPRHYARELLLLELARSRSGVFVDRAADIQAAFWMLVPPKDR